MRGPSWYTTDPNLDFWEKLFFAIIERSKYDLFSKNKRYRLEAELFFIRICEVDPELVRKTYEKLSDS